MGIMASENDVHKFAARFDAARCRYLWKIGMAFSKTHPGLSRFYVRRMYSLIDKKAMNLKKGVRSSFCHYCGSFWMPDNHKTRLYPKPRLNKKLRNLLYRQQSRQWSLNRHSRKLLHSFQAASRKAKFVCQNCKKVTKVNVLKPSEEREVKLVLNESPEKIRKKKKAKKEVNAGLKIRLEENQAKKLKRDKAADPEPSGKSETEKEVPILSDKKEKHFKKQTYLKVKLQNEKQKKDLLSKNRMLKVFLTPLPDLWMCN